MKVVILCGGEGIRFQNNVHNVPKVLAFIGGKPILWHIMKYFQHYGFNDFILCLGNNKEDIIDFVGQENEDWTVLPVDTGKNTTTGGRVKMIKEYTGDSDFFVTYGDGLSDVELDKLLQCHKEHGKIATITSVRPFSQYGILHLDDDDHVTSFVEKPRMSTYVNGGFFIFRKEVFDYIEEDENLETSLFSKIVAAEQVMAYRHEGFWKSMDTFKENKELEDMWNRGTAKWFKW